MKLQEIFEKRDFNYHEFEKSSDVVDYLKSELNNRNITFGGSVTLDQIGLYEVLKENNNVAWHWKGDGLDVLDKDVYISSTNAITEDGKLINMDGNSNRVSNMLYGHKDVYIICGKNKIVKDYNQGIERIRKIAAPLNAKRVGTRTPCVHTGYCVDCKSPQRICRAETIIHRNPRMTKIHICLIDEELGY